MTIERDPAHDLFAQARTIGESCWLERAMFTMLGRWSTTESEAAIIVVLADHSRRHAWHSEVLFERLPELADVDPNDFITPSTSAEAGVVDAAQEATDTLRRLVGGYRVIGSHLIVRQRRLLDQVDNISSPSTHRWVQRILDDLLDEWVWGEETIRELIRSDDDLVAASAHQQHLERLLLRS